jgi:hypothetical protein
MFVYADGRLIRQQEADRPYGANASSTGYLEQRLMPEGVEPLRSEAISTGLFERNRLLVAGKRGLALRCARGAGCLSREPRSRRRRRGLSWSTNRHSP